MYSGKFSYTFKKCGLTAIVVIRAVFVFPLPTAKTLIMAHNTFLEQQRTQVHIVAHSRDCL